MDNINSSSQKKAVIAYIIVCIIWGSTYLGIRIAVLDLPPLLSAGIRFIGAGLIMFGYAYFKRRPFPQKDQLVNQSIVGLLLLFAGNGMLVIGSQWLNSSMAALIFAASPLFMAVGELILPHGSKLTPMGWIGLFVGFGGVGFLVLGGGESLNVSFKGAVCVLFATVFWACGSTFSKRRSTGGAMEYSLSIQMLAGGLGLALAALLTGETEHMSISLPGVLAILYLIFFGSLLGYNAYIYLLSVWPASKAGTYAYVNPFVAILLGYLILDEPLTFHVFFGAGIILLGVFLVQFKGTEKFPQPESERSPLQ